MELKKANILDIGVATFNMQETVQYIEKLIAERTPSLIATANAEMLMLTKQDQNFKEILQKAELVVPDGAGTVWAANYLGEKMPERVAGYDLVQELLAIAPRKKWRVYFFGSAPGIAEQAKVKAEVKYRGVEIVGVRNGYFSEADNSDIVADIRAKKPDILLVALGVPKQEKWLFKYKDELAVPVSIGVGGTFDVMAGAVKRAPVWMQKAKLEWLFRGLLQPKRIGRLMALPKFVFAVRAFKRKIGQKK